MSETATNEKIETHDTLNPILFDENKELIGEVKDTLVNITTDFAEEVKDRGNIDFPIKDIILVGSNVSFNYTNRSDIDLHIIINDDELKKDDLPLYALIYDAYKGIYNTNHTITIKNIPVELYVEFGQTNVESNGVYSLNSGWIKEPSPMEVEESNEEEFEQEFKKWEDRYLELIQPYADKLADEVEDLHPDLTESLLESKQDELNFQNKFGDKLTQRFLAVRNKLSSPENDYYYWIKNKNEDELDKYLTTIESTKSKTQQKQELKQEGAELVYDKDGWKVYKILTYDASKFYGKGTKWCISGNYSGAESRGKYYFDDYKKKGVKDYYFIISPNDNKWCYLDYGGELNDEQFFNAPDTGIYVSNIEVDPMFFTIPLEIFDILPNINQEYVNSVKENFEFYAQIEKCFEHNGSSLTIRAEYENLSPRLKRQMNRKFVHTLRLDILTLIIEEGVKTIPECMFFGFTNLETITLPSSVKVIEENAFSFAKIKEIDLSNVEVIEDNAFSHCDQLKQVTLNPNTEYLGDCFEDDGIHIDFYIKGKELNRTLQQGLSHVSKDKIHLI